MFWFEYPIGVPFGNPDYDTSLGGSHDLTILAPPNMPVTALRSGVVASITAPSWGKQVGIRLDVPVNGIAFMAYLHLAAVNLALVVGSRVEMWDSIVGWVGGGNTEGDYQGTSNPTGSNFLDTPEMSSQVQVGIALMRGTEYGVGDGWETFPPIDRTLDPTALLTMFCGCLQRG